MLPDDLTKANEDHTMIRTRYDLSDTVLCSADVILDQLTFIGSVKFQDLAFDPKQRSVADSTLKLIESRAHVNFNGLNCKVRFVSSSNLVGIFGIPVERQHHNSYGHFSNLDTEPVVIDVAIDQFHFKWLGATQPNFFRLDVNKISAIIINESVEILVGAVTSWLAFVGDLNMILNDFSERRSHQLQAFIAAIADFAREDQTGTDPVFLTRPSNVLRMGARNFRNDVGWKLLAHMRHLLRMMPTVTAEELQRRLTSGEGIKNIDSKRLFKDVIGTFSQWRSWEIGDISRARLFTQPFNQNNPEPANNESDPIGELIDILMTSVNLGHIRVGKMEFCIFEEDMNDDNSIIIATIEVDVDSEFREDQIAGNDGVRRSTDSDRLRQAVLGYLDVICRLRIGLIDITVNPTILAFSKHMLKVQRVFAAKLAALDAANRKTKAAVSATKPTAESSVQAKESKRMSGQTTTTLDQHQAAASTFNVKVLMSRLDVLAQVLIAVDQVMISASAQNLSMKNEVAGVQASALFSNPRLTSWPLEKVEADNVSGIRSSHKGSRKSDKYSNRLIVSMTGGVENVITYIEEKTFTSAGVGYNTLLSLNLAGISSSAAMSRQSQKTRQKRLEQDREIFNVLFTIAGVSIKLPQSLLKLYNFVEGWSAENLRSYDFLFKNLMDEWEEQRKGSSSNIVSTEHPAPVKAPAPTTTANREIKIQCLLKNLAFQSDLLPSLNLQYEAWNIFFMLQQSLPNLLGPGLSYACQLSKQEIRFVTRSNSKNKAERLRIDASEGQTGSWAIPVIRAIGNIRALEPEIKNVPADSRRGSGVSSNSKAIMPKLNSYLSLDFVSLALDVSMIDHLLTAQSLVGNEINEVLDLFSFAKRRKESGVEHTVTTPTPSSLAVLLYSIEISLRGLRVMALSPAAIGFFESNILSGFVTNAPIARNHHHLNSDKLAWKVSAHNFSLSLNHNTGDLQDKFYEDANTRSYRLAYIVIDVALQNYRASPLEISKANTQEDARVSDDEVDSFFLQFPKIHAVMQPIALGKLTDLYIYYDTELKRRSQKKADEIEKLAANTRRILQSLDVEVPKVTENSRSLLEERLISLQISKFAAAIPLDSRDDVISITTEAPSEVGALLLSVASIDFLTRKWETSCAKMGDISIQFVTRFDQSKEEHFAPNYHHKMNRISFPSISCEVHAGTVQSKQHIWIDAKVDGFEVDVDGTIVHHVNTLNDIYRSSLARVNAFTAETNFGLRSDENRVKIEIQQPPESKDESPKITFLDIEGSFVYCAGVCKLYPKSHSLRQSSQSSRKSTPGGKSTTRTVTPPVPLLTTGKSIFASSVTMDDARRAESGVAEIHIPGLSAWATYQTPMGDNAASSTIQKGAHVEVVIHPSENKLHPSLVPFLQEVVAGLKIGMQQSSEPKVESSSMTPISPIVGMNFSLYLQLSKTRLGLSCQPISKVMCELNWEEGNFLMGVASTDDNIQTMTCVGQIRGASGNVRHMFSPEPCLSAELKDILFNVMLMTRRTETVNDDSISIVIDIPHILADLNIRHLQDLFLLQSVWLDQSIIDIMSGLPEQPKSPSASPSSNGMDGVEAIVNEQALATPKPFAKYFAVRLQRLDLSSDLGQAIGKVSFTTKNAKINTRDIPGHRKSIRASTDIIHLKSEGRLVGTASMEGLFLDGQFERPAFDCVVINGMSLAKLTFKTSQILASLEYEYQKILVASIDPIHLTCSDVWSEAGLEAPSAIIDVYVSLDTVVVLGSVKTIPVFINMSDKLIALVEEKRALAESSVKTRVLKVELAPGVSELSKSLPTNIPAIVTPVEIALKEWLIRPQGKMVLDLHTAKLTVFPNHFYDADCVQINAKDMHIDLMRDVVDPVREHRDLNVQLKNATLLKSQTKKVTRTDEKNMTTDQWFDHANSSSSKNIFGIPTTKLTMETWQTFGDKKIEHRFVTVFDGRVDIALNFGLIKYLQDLATLYAEQIKKSAPTGASSETPRSPAANPPALPPWENPGDPAAAAAGAKIISLPPATDPSSSTISTGELTFHPIEPVKLDPQLRVMGDATPPLEWVGVQRQKIPALVHTELTLNLEKILLVLQGLYKSQLSEMVRMTQ
ncbi:hypothetical protein BC936DRAFT_136583 [Jimgerdemannia flammicorona]|uniref:Csf1 C-terminal region domain-containing protein n=1 Tax=Jimgerdemannia flammicorona TaxID=994334 RepID=A0A433CZ74_9FUNG|nr:hypothetical protein BC936DRAFT_136583 [Jimgerdemannia flammicorona]